MGTLDKKELKPKIKTSSNRLKKHLIKELDKFVFLHIAKDLLEKEELRELMEDIPLPLEKKKIEKHEDIKGEDIMQNLVFVLGIDRQFPYKKQYMTFLLAVYRDKIVMALLDLALVYLSNKQWIEACAAYRAVLLFKPKDMNGLYGYARACREVYLEEDEDEEKIGDFKAESFETFEELTILYPEFADAYFYLGYGYLNMGLYVKTQKTFERFLQLAEDADAIEEVKQRLSQIETPVKLELACNDVISGRLAEGKAKLEEYEQGKYIEWWPLHYYLGIANAGLENTEEAIANFKQVLLLSPSNVDAMTQLVILYRKLGDREKEKKYAKKIDIVVSGRGSANE